MEAGRYGVILADPPWSYRVDAMRGVAADQYETLDDDAIASLAVDGLPVRELGKPDSVLLLWTTWPKLEAGLQTVAAWGYQYVTGFPWIKIIGQPTVDLWGDLRIVPSYGVGFWVRGASEPLLIGRRGSVVRPDGGMVGLLCDRMQHSRKPDNVHHYAEQLEGPYLELFARRRRPGWDVWGHGVRMTVIGER